jgi:hypothetical protein
MEMFKQKINFLKQNKLTSILVLVAILIIGFGGYLIYQKTIVSSQEITGPVEEKDLSFDPEGPYGLLTPRPDGNALVLNLKRTSSYDSIGYELAYNAEGIDRGVVGEINTKEKRGEYTQEILFGTCSKNVCKYDTGVENGTLTLHIRKGKEAFRMTTQWRLQKPVTTLGVVKSGDDHFVYTTDPKKADLALAGFSITNDLTGAPKLPSGKKVIGKVYAMNLANPENLPAGDINIDLGENPPADSKISVYSELEGNWKTLDTKISGSKLTASGGSAGIYAVLSDSK